MTVTPDRGPAAPGVYRPRGCTTPIVHRQGGRDAPNGHGQRGPATPGERRPRDWSTKSLRSDRGSATVAAVGVTAVLLLLTVSALTLSSAMVASHRARSAADLASLAGASALMRGEAVTAACARAAAIARRSGAALVSCAAVGAGALEVRAEVRPTAPGLAAAVSSARAGPPLGGGG